jgi:pseudouridine synthase
MRINKYLAESGVASRRASDRLIEDGVVKINGKVAKLGDEVGVDDLVTVKGLPVSAVKRFDYYIMNKPKGYVCTVKDDKDRKTVMELLPPNVPRIFPVGRLDYDTEGLLIFTNDGDLTYKLTHPKNEVPKTYLVKTETFISDEGLKALRNGVEIDGVMTKKCHVKLVDRSGNKGTKLHITITEGRNRQIRKMIAAVGAEVDFLKRIKLGELTCSGLDRGDVRKLTKSEIDYLKSL